MGELGYKVEEQEDMKKKREEWEKGKSVPASPAKPNNPEDAGYKVETEGVKNRLEKWKTMGSKPSPEQQRKDPIKIPTQNVSKDQQTDVKTVKYEEEQ